MQTTEKVIRLFCYLLWHVVQVFLFLAAFWLIYQGGHGGLATGMIALATFTRHEELDPEGKRVSFNIWPFYTYGRWKAEQKRAERDRQIMVEYIKASKLVSLKESGIDPDLVDKIELNVTVGRG